MSILTRAKKENCHKLWQFMTKGKGKVEAKKEEVEARKVGEAQIKG